MTSQAGPTDDGGDGVEQFSARSAARLREATEELISVLRGYTEMITAMHGGSAEMLERFAPSDAAQAAAWAWNERAFDHSGSFVLALAGDRPPAEGEDFDDEDPQDEDAELQVV